MFPSIMLHLRSSEPGELYERARRERVGFVQGGGWSEES